MALASTSSFAPTGRPLGPGAVATAFAGLTPGLCAVVALLCVALATDSALFGFAASGDSSRALPALLTGALAVALMAVPLVLAVVAAGNLGPPRGLPRWAVLAGAAVLAALAGALLRLSLSGTVLRGPAWSAAGSFLPSVVPRYAALGLLLAALLELRRRVQAQDAELAEAEANDVAHERDWAAARMARLEAQIEPHFLFNTLAHVRRLAETDPAAGRRVLAHLREYLAHALPQWRDPGGATLGGEARLVESYLRIQQARLGARLDFAVEVPASLAAARLPPMMLLTLVENAVEHGIEPLPGGGSIRVTAAADGAWLVVEVADTGRGFAAGSGSGTGLANIRSRLDLQFGAAAALRLGNAPQGGAVATLQLPLVRPAAG